MHAPMISPRHESVAPDGTDAPRRPVPAAPADPAADDAPQRVHAILDACSHDAAPERGGWVVRRRTTSPLETRFITR